jgi:thimet oligopeptidase
MSQRLLMVAAVCLSTSGAACGGNAKPTEAPVPRSVVDADPRKPRPMPDSKKNPVDVFFAQCRDGLHAAEAALPAILAVKGERTLANTLAPYNDVLIGLSQSGALAGLYAEVHPDESIRDAARTCEQEVTTFASELSLNRDLFQALAAVDVSKEDAETRRFVEHTLRDFRRAGVDRDDATRARLKQIDEDLTRLGQQFSKTLAEDVRSIEVKDAKQLGGLPDDFVAAHPPGPDGTIRITTDYPDYNPFMTYAVDDGLRRQLYVQARSRGGEANERLMQDILRLRAEKAKILGFANFADYITEDKMIKSGKKAADFIDRVWKLADKRAKRDYDELLKQLKVTDKHAKAVGDWQKIWLENQVRKKKYEVSSEEVRQYFPYQQVLDGLLDVTATIYDIQYVPAAGVAPWHEDVKVYDVMRKGTALGRIYLDMHPREGKYKHAAQFTLKDGVAGRQHPEGVLVCNFPNPRTSGGPALMEHDDVVTMFHEFGHLMHHVLGGNHRWIRQSGVATEHDFVEAPSQMFEEWAWNYETLSRFGKHHATGQVIPRELVEKMRRADKFGVGTQTVQQMFYAALSLDFHTADPTTLNQLEEAKRLQKKYTPFAYVEGTRFHAGFGHLVGYSATYYTYMWSLVIAKDLLTPFEKTSLMDTKVTYAYRDDVLVPGGAKDAADLVKDFLGREYSFTAFEKYLSE